MRIKETWLAMCPGVSKGGSRAISPVKESKTCPPKQRATATKATRKIATF